MLFRFKYFNTCELISLGVPISKVLGGKYYIYIFLSVLKTLISSVLIFPQVYLSAHQNEVSCGYLCSGCFYWYEKKLIYFFCLFGISVHNVMFVMHIYHLLHYIIKRGHWKLSSSLLCE